MLYVFSIGLCLVVLPRIGSVKSYETVQRSVVVLIGERVELKCSIPGNDVASWKYTSWNSSSETLIYLGKNISNKFRSMYKIDKNISGQHNLIIDFVDLVHAGRYRCSGVRQPLISDIQLIVLGRANDSGVSTDVSTSPIGLRTFAVAGPLLVLLAIALIIACVVYRKRLKGDSSVRPDVALNTYLTSYDGIALSSELSPNYILAGDCSTGRSDGRMISDNAVYAEVCKPRGSDGRMISNTAVYAEVCKPSGPSKGHKGRNIGDNSRSLQHPTRVRKDLIGDDGTEYVNMGEGKSTDRKGVRHVSDPTAFSHETIYTSIDHSGRVPRPPLPTEW